MTQQELYERYNRSVSGNVSDSRDIGSRVASRRDRDIQSSADRTTRPVRDQTVFGLSGIFPDAVPGHYDNRVVSPVPLPRCDVCGCTDCGGDHEFLSQSEWD